MFSVFYRDVPKSRQKKGEANLSQGFQGIKDAEDASTD